MSQGENRMRSVGETFRVVKFNEWWSQKRQDSHSKASLILLKAVAGSAENLVARKNRVLPIARRDSNLLP